MPNNKVAMNNSLLSSYREMVLEHLFVGELMRHAWLTIIAMLFICQAPAAFADQGNITISETKLMKVEGKHKPIPDLVDKEIRGIVKRMREVRKKYGFWNKHVMAFSLAEYNDVLKKYGYELKDGGYETNVYPRYDLFKNGEINSKSLNRIRCLGLNKDQSEFIFYADQYIGGTPAQKGILIEKNKITEWGLHEYQCPFYLKDGMYWIEPATGAQKNIKGSVYNIVKDSTAIFTFGGYSSVKELVDSFYGYGNDWILEYTNKVVINGKPVGENRYDEVFNYVFIKDKPFYFLKNKGKYFLSYNGKILNNKYDTIPHNLCCEPFMLNPVSTSQVIAFFASRNNYWYYVEVSFQ